MWYISILPRLSIGCQESFFNLNCNISVSEAIFFIGLTPFSVIVLLLLKLVACLGASGKVISGFPQGSVLGPLLFIVYTADVKYSVRSSWVMYADDMKIYSAFVNSE
jgi:hypothetical protein